MAFPRLQCQLPLSPPAVPHDIDTAVPLLSAPHYTRAEKLDILFPTSYVPQCPLCPLPLWLFPPRFPISCIPCSTITQPLTNSLEAAERDVVDVSVLVALLRLSFLYRRARLPARLRPSPGWCCMIKSVSRELKKQRWR